MIRTIQTYEYCFLPVPLNRRKPTGELMCVMAGFAFSSTGFTLGAKLGSTMTFERAVPACMLGNLLVFLTALFWGLLACQTGKNAPLLIEERLGSRTAKAFSCLMLLFLILWIGINGDILANFTTLTFPRLRLPFAFLVVLALLPVIWFSRGGWKNIVLFSRLFLVPLFLLTGLCCVRAVAQSGGLAALLAFTPDEHMGFPAAVASVLGNFALSTLMMTELCRYAKDKRTVCLCVGTYAAVIFLCNLCGILMVQASGSARNLNYGFYLLHLTKPGVLLMMLCLCTTQNVNLYIGSLALQHIVRRSPLGGNISHPTAVSLIGGIGIIVGICGIDRYMMDFGSFLLTLVVLLSLTFFLPHRRHGADR